MCAADSEDPRAKIIVAVEERWQSHGSAYLLSQLGVDFAIELAAISAGRKLKPIMEQDFAEALRLVFDPVRLWGVVPADKAGIEPAKAFVGTHANAPKFQLAVWAAFRKALPTGLRRFLVQHEQGYLFTDRPATDPPPPAPIFEVPPEQICPADMPPPQVAEEIRKFIEDSGLSLEDYLAKPIARKAGALGAPATGRPHASALDALLGALSTFDMRRIILPLDIIAKLRGHPIDRR